MTEQEIADLKAKHPGVELHLLENAEHEMSIVVRVPSQGDWQRFRSMQADDAQRPQALRVLLLGALVQPSASEFGAVLMGKPALAETFGAEVVKIAGLSSATIAKKL